MILLNRQLQSQKHNEFQEGLEKLGKLIGYDSYRPKHEAATDCLWRGVFGNQKLVLTIEAKIEDTDSGRIVPSDIGQVHNQMMRAKAEYEHFGYTVRGIIITHLSEILPEADSSAGDIRILNKESIFSLWQSIKAILIEYRSRWSLNDITIRKQAAEVISK